ncbi:MAG: DUF2089 family protein [Fuerstiella sp.]
MSTSITNICPYCQHSMAVKSMECGHCHVCVEANFPLTRLGELPIEHQRFIEMFVLASGSLKEIAQQTGVSYPTVRSRLNRIIEELRTRIASPDSKNSETILDVMETVNSHRDGVRTDDPRASARELIKRI